VESLRFEVRVIGHELVTKKEEHLCKVKLRNPATDVKVELLIAESDRVKYPLGSTAVLSFAVQQSIPLPT
jgi:hypothetical protein